MATDGTAPGDALRLESVTRVFGALTAIENISFSVAAGERRAVIGANGAGKPPCSTSSPAISRRPAAGCCSSART